jgi:hypothetical protein
MLSEYTYAPQGPKPTPAPDSLHSSATPALRGTPLPRNDAIAMAPFEVSGSKMTGGASLMALAEPAAPRPTVTEKLGIGVHHFKLGKVHMFTKTVFYIPFLIGIEW